MFKHRALPALSVLAAFLASCATPWTPATFDATQARGKWSTPVISSATAGPHSPMVDSKWRHTLLIDAVNGEPRLVAPVETEQISSAAFAISLAPLNFLGGLFGPTGPQIRVLEQHWDHDSLTLSATQGEIPANPPQKPEALRITFHSPNRGLLEFQGRQYPLRNDPEAFVPSYRPPRASQASDE